MNQLRSLSTVTGWAFAVMLALAPPPVHGQAAEPRPIVGDWEGTLDPGAKPKQKIVVHIAEAQDGTLSGTLDYPDQDVSGVQMTAITYKERVLHFECSSNLSVYDGTMSADHKGISGTLKQSGGSLSLNLKRTPGGG